MGRRKRSLASDSTSTDHITIATPSEDMPLSTGTELFSIEKSSPGIIVSDSTVKPLSMPSSQFLKRSRHSYRHQYSRRNSRTSTPSREKPFGRAERMVCGICQKLLMPKPYFLGDTDTPSWGEYSAVAVLVCGHVYHADCLENRTDLDDVHDPSCPLCLCPISPADTSREQE
ncbi:hypothetical protein K2173_020821 [Erythroxylum novogranatense]|uniref:RING-type domain-containing protein n=1 Tax=Erythroxylum novogranatense TaxID=1862640 RepID=A0AAV8TN52_9ROSI|nr:hypothetical protein K2173_020821 [Erythroxylum novogranatense]